MDYITEKTFKRFVIWAFAACMLSFFIGKGWHHKELKRLKEAGQTTFWFYHYSASERIKDPKGWDQELVLGRVEDALRWKEYSHASDQVIHQLEHWRDSLTIKIKEK